MSDEAPNAAGSSSSPERAGFRVTGRVVALAWAIAVAFAYIGTGGYLAQMIEGQDPALLSKTGVILAELVLLAAVVLTVIWARGRGRAPGDPTSAAARVGRRNFLVGTGATVGGLAGVVVGVLGRLSGWWTITGRNIIAEAPTSAASPSAEWKGARVREYRRLGRTDFEVSDISLGSGQLPSNRKDAENLAREAIERGINYFDTAPDYSEAGSELALGGAIQGKRDNIFLATKFCTPHGNLPAGTSVDDYVAAVEGSLKRLQTDYVDLVHIHSCDTLERLLDPNVHEAFDRLKQQGKARFLGFSSHTPNLEQVANTSIEDGRFDVMMLAYHHGAWPTLPDIMSRAKASGMGVVAMKTLKGARHRGLLEMRDEADSYTQAAFKWVLSNPDVACLVISFRERRLIDEYLFASGKRPSSQDYAILEKYERAIAGTHCAPHCGACLDSCPEQLSIPDVLRHRMYFEDYGDQKEGMRQYSKLEVKADVCTGCSAPCTGSCPYGIDIKERTSEAHRMLTFA